MPAWLATAQAQTVDEIKKKGELTVGLLVDFPPYGTINAQNEPDGYDADVARLLAKDWGVKLNLVPVTGPNRIPFLLTNKVDLLVASLAITPERAKQVQFSKPYAAATIVLLAPRRPTIKGAGRPEGPARRRRPRQHAGHRAHRGRAARAPRSAASTTTRRRMQALMSGQVDAHRLLDHGRRADRQARAGRTPTNRSSCCKQQEMGVAMRPGQTELLKAVERLRRRRTRPTASSNKLYQKWLETDLPKMQCT